MKIMIAYDGSRNARLALVMAVAENPRDITSGNEDLLQQELSEL